MEWKLTGNWKEEMEAAETNRVRRRWLRNSNSKAIPQSFTITKKNLKEQTTLLNQLYDLSGKLCNK